MPKMKTHKGTKKRFRLTANGQGEAPRGRHQPPGRADEPETQAEPPRHRHVVDKVEAAKIRIVLGKHSY